MLGEPLKVLIADDEPTVLSLMRSILEEHDKYLIELAGNGMEALAKLRRFQPDLLITDLKMPRMSGEDLTAQALLVQPDLTILVATGNATLHGAIQLMKDGVYDFITKPFLVDDFLASIERAVSRIRTVPLTKDSQAIVGALMTALEAKDTYLKNHSSRVASLSRQLGIDLGLSKRDALLVERAALVHDLGKIGVPEAILNKAGPLTPEEFARIKKHPIDSVNIIRPLKEFKDCIDAVLHHHERLDGKGYPGGLKGEEIPVAAKVIAVCDAYDAMASDRAYRSSLPPEKIRENLLHARGSQLEGGMVETFLKRMDAK